MHLRSESCSLSSSLALSEGVRSSWSAVDPREEARPSGRLTTSLARRRGRLRVECHRICDTVCSRSSACPTGKQPGGHRQKAAAIAAGSPRPPTRLMNNKQPVLRRKRLPPMPLPTPGTGTIVPFSGTTVTAADRPAGQQSTAQAPAAHAPRPHPVRERLYPFRVQPSRLPTGPAGQQSPTQAPAAHAPRPHPVRERLYPFRVQSSGPSRGRGGRRQPAGGRR